MTTVSYQFWNVGQGLFSSGKIEPQNGKTFCWVYDCGTASAKSNLLPVIQNMQKQYPNEIDLLIISHFDYDHIKGIDELLKNQTAKHWLLPYYPLWQRLLIAELQGVKQTDPFFAFFENPVAYLLEKTSSLPEKIFLFPVNNQGEISSDEQFKEDDELHYFSTNFNPDDEIFNISNEKIKLITLDPTKPIYYQNIVEFVPYNIPFNANFKIYQNSIDTILNDTSLTISQKIANLKSYHNSLFSDLNRHSLFLYVRILPKVSNANYLYKNKTHPLNFHNKSALLYTGDGYLSNQQEMNDLALKLGSLRMNKISCFQVPHHGSKTNWFAGLANIIQPYLSIFSADPDYGSYRHPDGCVVFDFILYTPVLVDRNINNRFTLTYFI